MQAFIYGAGAHGRIALDILRAQAEHDAIAFIDDRPEAAGTELNGAPIAGDFEWLLGQDPSTYGVVVAIGNPPVRAKVAARLREHGVPLINAIHPSAVITPTARLGVGNIISPLVLVDTDAVVGDLNVVNASCVIEHDCVVGDGCTFSPAVHLGGRVEIGSGVFLSIGAKLVPRVKVGDGAVIGAGSVVLKDVAPKVMVMGSPARLVWKVEDDFDWSKLL